MWVYRVSLWAVCLRQNLQYFLNENRSGVCLLFLVVL